MNREYAVYMKINKALLNKVPEITLLFWIIKIICTTIGETIADFMNVDLGLGLTITTTVMVVISMFVLYIQLRSPKYKANMYWTLVALISIVGTLITDNLTDVFNVPLWASTLVFSITLAGVFWKWFSQEKTLSIQEIDTPTREKYYWLAILTTFALGTALGDFLAESLSLGYFNSILLFGGAIALLYLVYKRNAIGSVLAFWAVYILTRPLGASIGDYLIQPKDLGGLGLSVGIVSGILLGILFIGVLFTKTKNSKLA